MIFSCFNHQLRTQFLQTPSSLPSKYPSASFSDGLCSGAYLHASCFARQIPYKAIHAVRSIKSLYTLQYILLPASAFMKINLCISAGLWIYVRARCTALWIQARNDYIIEGRIQGWNSYIYLP